MGLHAPHAAALDGLFHFLAKRGSVAALEGVFPAFHPLTAAARPRAASPAALHPGDHARRLADGVPSLHLVEISHGLPSTLRLLKDKSQTQQMCKFEFL